MESRTVPPDFGKRLRAARAFADDISRGDFAELLGNIAGASESTLRDYERGTKVPPPLVAESLVPRLASATALPESFFWAGASGPRRSPRVSDIPPAEQAARIRAAIGYSGKEAEKVAEALGISYATLRRRKTTSAPTGATSMEELHDIADVCGVPRSFVESGFTDGATERPPSDPRIDRLERRVEQLATSLEELHATLLEKALLEVDEPGASAGHRQTG